MRDSELENRLQRAFGGNFLEDDYVIDVFKSVFTDYPFKKLEQLDHEGLEEVIADINTRREVEFMRRWIHSEIQLGREQLNYHVRPLAIELLEGAGILPEHTFGNYTSLETREFGLFRLNGGNPEKLAITQLDEGTNSPTPMNVVYEGHKLPWVLKEGELPQLNDPEFFLRKDARSIVFKERVGSKERKRIAKEILKYAVAELTKGQGKKESRFCKYEAKLVKEIGPLYPQIINGKGPNYESLYTFFDLVNRGNIDLEPQMGTNPFVVNLYTTIKNFIDQPYAILRTRTKALERTGDKVSETFFDVPRVGTGDKKARETKDLYAGRLIFPTVDNVYGFEEAIERSDNIIIEDRKDYINPERKKHGRHKDNGYKSLHMQLRYRRFSNDKGLPVELQLRTQEMDKQAETDPKQKHDGAFMDEKQRMINEKVPYQVRRIVSVMIGEYRPTALNN